jgi:alpha-glucosidase
MQMARASREGALRHAPDRRPFVITRAGYAGIQRYSLVWTGDNSSNWDHLNDAVQMFLNLSLSGVPFCGGDVGGFLDNATPELFTRWFQLAAFTPFFRNHTNLGTIDQEPWAFGEGVESICRHYLRLRYRLLPYLYGLFAEARRSGAPIMRPMLWHYQSDPPAAACSDQFMLGRNLLIAPVLRQGSAARSVYLPNDVWFDFWTGEKITGGGYIIADAPSDTIPIFVRAGAIIPMSEVQQFVGERPQDIIELHCWPGGADQLEWYEDDGVSQGYERGVVCRRTLTSRTVKRRWELHLGPESGDFMTEVKTWRLILWGAAKAGALRVNGVEVKGSFDAENRLFAADFPNPPGEARIEFTGL